jgi:2-hydroxycyclohexanecarboxyl-CoA dehydrogenase
MFDLTGKAAIVTGGARGIGKGIVTCLAEQGANVAIADLLKKEADATAEEVRAMGVDCIALETDITDMKSVKAMVDAATKHFGQIDILVNNVGWDIIRPFVETTEEFWDKVIAINYRGHLNVIRSVIDQMAERNSGRIISIASDAGRVGSMGESIYSGTKGGLIAFSKTMARELARNKITVNVVCPGPTYTPLMEEMAKTDEFVAKIFSKMERTIPLRRTGTPEDIGAAVAFLASDEANFITGQTLSVSGGLTMVD